MKITKENKTTFFLQKEGVKLYGQNGLIAIPDIRTSFMGLLLSPFRVTYPYKSFKNALINSNLKNCSLKKGFFWIDIKSKI